MKRKYGGVLGWKVGTVTWVEQWLRWNIGVREWGVSWNECLTVGAVRAGNRTNWLKLQTLDYCIVLQIDGSLCLTAIESDVRHTTFLFRRIVTKIDVDWVEVWDRSIFETSLRPYSTPYNRSEISETYIFIMQTYS